MPLTPEQEQEEMNLLKEDMDKEVGSCNLEAAKIKEADEEDAKEFSNYTYADIEKAIRLLCYHVKVQERLSKIMGKASKDKTKDGMFAGPMGPMLAKAFSGK